MFELGGLPVSVLELKSPHLLAVFLLSFHLQSNGKNEIRAVFKIIKEKREESVKQYVAWPSYG